MSKNNLPIAAPEAEVKRALEEAVKRGWHHNVRHVKVPDAKRPEGHRYCRVEDVVTKFQETGSEELFELIMENYQVYESKWAKLFANYNGGNVHDAKQDFRVVLFYSVRKYDGSKAMPTKEQRFNALLASSGCNTLKNFRNKVISQKNHPHICCEVCDEPVYEIDAKHLLHRIDFERYKETFPRHPLASRDGLTRCPATGQDVPEVSQAHLNRIFGAYKVEDFAKEFAGLMPSMPLSCPVTGMPIKELTAAYPSFIKAGYSEAEFVRDFPDFPGIIRCPFSGDKLLEMTQAHLDRVLGQQPGAKPMTLASFVSEFPHATLKARKVKVINPYTGQKVDEITPAMLAKAGTTLIEHLEKHAMICLDEYYPQKVVDPFSGGRTHKVKREYLAKIGKTSMQFYETACQYPLRKWQVKCAFCGQWVDEIWTHLEQVPHFYAPPYTVEEYEQQHGPIRKFHVTNNSYVEDGEGKRVHIADLFVGDRSTSAFDMIDVEDSLLKASQDEVDIRIAKAVRWACTLDDVFYKASDRRAVSLPSGFKLKNMEKVKRLVRDACGTSDFGLVMPREGAKSVVVMTPGRTSIRKRLSRMIQESDLLSA